MNIALGRELTKVSDLYRVPVSSLVDMFYFAGLQDNPGGSFRNSRLYVGESGERGEQISCRKVIFDVSQVFKGATRH